MSPLPPVRRCSWVKYMSCDTLVTPRPRLADRFPTRPHHTGATLTTVPGGNNAITTREAAVEILALNVFGVADRTEGHAWQADTHMCVEKIAHLERIQRQRESL